MITGIEASIEGETILNTRILVSPEPGQDLTVTGNTFYHGTRVPSSLWERIRLAWLMITGKVPNVIGAGSDDFDAIVILALPPAERLPDTITEAL